MLLEDVFHRVEEGLTNFGRYLLAPDPHAQLRGKIAERTEDLRDSHQLLRNTRQKLRDAERRLAENRQAVGVLSSRVESAMKRGEGSHAWHLARQVDRLRQEIARDQERLPHYEQMVWSIEFKVRQKVRELARLQEKLYGIPEVRRA